MGKRSEPSARGKPRIRGVAQLVAAALLACAAGPTNSAGASEGMLAPCPSTPNCVSSDAEDPSHGVAPFQLTAPAPEAWKAAVAAVEALPRTRIVARSGDALHAECRSAIFRFVDDLELELRPREGIIAVRSASRVGYSDLGVNRRRVEGLRKALETRGVVR